MGDLLFMKREELTFEDGILLCKHIFQCAIHKTLHGVPEEWDIYYKTHEALEKLNPNINTNELDEVLFTLDMDDVYTKM